MRALGTVAVRMAPHDGDRPDSPHPGFPHPHPEGRAGPPSHTPGVNPDPCSPTDRPRVAVPLYLDAMGDVLRRVRLALEGGRLRDEHWLVDAVNGMEWRTGQMLDLLKQVERAPGDVVPVPLCRHCSNPLADGQSHGLGHCVVSDAEVPAVRPLMGVPPPSESSDAWRDLVMDRLNRHEACVRKAEGLLESAIVDALVARGLAQAGAVVREAARKHGLDADWVARLEVLCGLRAIHRCDWCEREFPTESSRDSHTATACPKFPRSP